MAMNRVQFPQGMSRFDLFEQFGTEASVPSGTGAGMLAAGFLLLTPREYRARRAPWHRPQDLPCIAASPDPVIAGTLFESTKLPLPVWFLAIYLVGRLADVLPDDSGSEDLVPCDATLCLLAKPVEDAARSAQRQGAPDRGAKLSFANRLS